MTDVGWIVLAVGLYASNRIAYALGRLHGARETFDRFRSDR